MKHHLGWRPVTREEFADHLRHADVLAAEALGGTSLYRCRNADGETIAISLPGDDSGGGLLIEIRADRPRAMERRRAGGTAAPDE